MNQKLKYGLFFILFHSFLIGQSNSVLEKLKAALPNASFQALDNGHHFSEEWIIMLEQPLDHNNPELGTFQQRMFLAHYNFNEPMLIVTEGYSAYPRYYELSDLYKTNQLIVEYRFFGESKPDNYDYSYLTNDQAAADYHRIRDLLKDVYTGDWISTGISKGGTTCLIYKYKYPKDVKVTVPYVAPLPMGREDKRCDDFLNQIGSEACREKLFKFQELALSEKDSYLSLLDSIIVRDSINFTKISKMQAIEYAILEYTFSFWQYGHDCDAVPMDGSFEDRFDYLNEVVGFDFYCDESIDYYAPAFHQFMTENGYYGFLHDHLEGELEYVSEYTNLPFAPYSEDFSYDGEYLKYVRVYLYHKGDYILYIHGAMDPWSACKIVPSEKTKSLVMIDKDGDHKTRISTFDDEAKKMIYNTLEKWLNRHTIKP